MHVCNWNLQATLLAYTPPTHTLLLTVGSFSGFYSNFCRGNHLTSRRQLVGQTVNNQEMATDAIKADVKYEITVSH